MDDDVIKHQDLGTEKPVPDHDRRSPTSRQEGETVEFSGGIKGKVKSRAFLLVTYILAIATYAHFALAVNGLLSLVAGLTIIIAVCHPEYATGIIHHLSDLARKFKIK